MNILLIDDSAPILRGVEKMIRLIPGYDFDIRKALNAYEALEILQNFTPDLMIVDIIMPGMSGLEFLEKVFESGYAGKTILLTAYGEFSYAQQAIRLGVIDYLLKPIEESQLVKLITDMAPRIPSPEPAAQMLDARLLGLTDYSRLDASTFPPVLHLILKYINAHYRDDIALPMLAERCNISSTYVCSLFSAHLNTTFLAYLDQIRLQYAAYLLLNSNQSLEEIAQETGFKYASQLLRVFRKRVGITPSQFRKEKSSGDQPKDP